MSGQPLLPGQVPAQAARAAIAVLRGARDVRAVARACGWASLHQAHNALRAARDLDLVRWEDGRTGTLQPGLTLAPEQPGDVVVHGPRQRRGR